VEEKKSSLKDIIKQRRKINNSNGELEVEILVPKHTPPVHIQKDDTQLGNQTNTETKIETEPQSHTETQIQTQTETDTDTQTQISDIETKTEVEPQSQTQSNTETETEQQTTESSNEKSKQASLNTSLTTSMNSSDREARLSLRIESLRQLCEEYFGEEMFFKIYKYLRDNDEDENETQRKVKEMVPYELQKYLRFIDQLIYCEIQFYGS